MRANRQTSRVTIRSNLPRLASEIICINAGRFLAEVPVMPSSIYSVYSRGSISLQMQDGAGGFCCFFGCRGANSPVFGLPQQACRYSDREDRCCGCFVLQKTVHRLIYGSASTSVREVRISSISSPVTGGRVRPTWCASSRYKGWGGANAAAPGMVAALHQVQGQQGIGNAKIC